MVILTWNAYETIASLLTTEMNSLANDAYTAASGARGADGTGGPLYADFELVLGSINPTDNFALAELYLVRSADGTNYEDLPSANNRASGMYVGTFVGDFGSSAKRVVLPEVKLPPGLYKAVIKNISGVAYTASGNTLKIREFNTLST